MKLRSLLPKLKIESRIQRCGIYFLLLDGEVVYVGKSVAVESRIGVHRKERDKEFSEFAVYECLPDELDKWEAHFALLFNPKENTTIPNSKHWISVTTIKTTIVGNNIYGYGPQKIERVLRAAAVEHKIAFGRTYFSRKGVAEVFTEKELRRIKGDRHVARLAVSSGQIGHIKVGGMRPIWTLPNTKTTNKEDVSILPAERGREERP